MLVSEFMFAYHGNTAIQQIQHLKEVRWSMIPKWLGRAILCRIPYAMFQGHMH